MSTDGDKIIEALGVAPEGAASGRVLAELALGEDNWVAACVTANWTHMKVGAAAWLWVVLPHDDTLFPLRGAVLGHDGVVEVFQANSESPWSGEWFPVGTIAAGYPADVSDWMGTVLIDCVELLGIRPWNGDLAGEHWTHIGSFAELEVEDFTGWDLEAFPIPLEGGGWITEEGAGTDGEE